MYQSCKSDVLVFAFFLVAERNMSSLHAVTEFAVRLTQGDRLNLGSTQVVEGFCRNCASLYLSESDVSLSKVVV